MDSYNIKIALIIIIVIHLGLGNSCFSNEDTNVEIENSNQKIASNEKKNDISVNIPKGDEIEISIKVIAPKKAIMTIVNKSSGTVYLPHLAGDKNDFVYFMNYELQKLDEKTGKWKSYPPGDFGSGMRPLKAGELIKDRIMTSETGTFRINIAYFIDKQIYEEMQRISKVKGIKEKLKEYDKIEKETELSGKIITSNIFKLSG